jgi:hypothetical protein
MLRGSWTFAFVSVGQDFLVEPVKGYMAYIAALDHIKNELSDIGSVVPDTLNGLRDEHVFQANRNCRGKLLSSA